jgi:uncharacterized hydrophobic protein (TIGR00271 family)
MSLLSQIDNLSESDKNRAVRQLITESTPDFDFFLLVVLSVLMATFGLLVDSPSIVIGSMLIAPILSPILSISLGLVMSDGKLLRRSVFTVLKASVIGIISAALATLVFKSVVGSELTSEIIARTDPSLIYFFVAVVAGFAVSYTLAKPDLSETLPGIAVAVALIPPLSVVGIGLAKLDGAVISSSLTLYLINVIGIVLASVISFALMNLYGKRRIADATIQKEEKRLKEELKQAEKYKEKIKEANGTS